MLNLILAALPALGGLISGGKGDAVIAAGAKIAQEVFGTTDERSIAKQIETNPALAEQFKAKLEAETSALQAALADVQDARATTVALASQGGWNANAAAILTAINYVGFFGVLILLVMKGLPDNARELVAGMIGAIVGAYVGSNNFWFGSSAGSASKDTALKQIASKR
jgi:hypothetical protein